jgi:hypothetical protein
VSNPGAVVGRLLSGAWRRLPPTPTLSGTELAEVSPLLLASGSGALAWWAVRNSPLATTPAALELREAHRAYALRAAVHDREVADAFRRLRAQGVEAVLVKGWAAARLYPRRGLRAYGDVDLLLAAPDLDAAQRALLGFAGSADLHPGGGWLSDRPWTEVVARSQVVPLDGTEVRVAGAEDHLRYLGLHFLGHGGWRPLWLCDVGAALESLPDGFDWDYFRSGDARRSTWAAQALALAGRVLGAQPVRPIPGGAALLPGWLESCVLREWSRPPVPHGTRTPMASVLRTPWRIPASLWQRWPNPVEAALDLGRPLGDGPRMPLQLAACATRTARFVRALAG